jgi:hypothetical protein
MIPQCRFGVNNFHRTVDAIQTAHTITTKMISKTRSMLLVVVLVAATMAPCVVGGEIAHVVIFNKNQVRSDMSCTDAEFALIRDTIVQAANKRRLSKKTAGRGGGGARGLKSSLPVAATASTPPQRRVQTKCTNCGPYCGAGGTGCPGKGGRRRRQLAPPLTMASCQAKIPAVDDALKQLERSLPSSGSCRKLVGSSRDISCHEFTNDCGVSYVSLMDRGAVLVQKLPPTGTTFCQSTKVSFLATTSFWLGVINFDLKSTNGFSDQRSEDEAPYYMDGDSGKEYQAGNYTLTVASQYSDNQVQTIRFRVNSC